jgi:hypothetical protein
MNAMMLFALGDQASIEPCLRYAAVVRELVLGSVDGAVTRGLPGPE